MNLCIKLYIFQAIFQAIDNIITIYIDLYGYVSGAFTYGLLGLKPQGTEALGDATALKENEVK